MIQKIRIHLADDHLVLIDGLTNLLSTVSDFEIVGSSSNGLNIFDEVVTNNADILVLDLSMPEKDGVEVLKEFNKKGYPCKVIILSSYDDLKIIKEVMKLGASGYLTKKCAGENIIEAIEVVNQGEEYFCTSVREKIFNTFTENNPKLNKSVFCLGVNLTSLRIVSFDSILVLSSSSDILFSVCLVTIEFLYCSDLILIKLANASFASSISFPNLILLFANSIALSLSIPLAI